VAINPAFRDFALEQLQRALPAIRSRSMFGGVGIYSEDLFFALIDDESLYFKVSDDNRGDFEARGMGPFRPFGDAGEVMQYYEVPADLLDDPDALRPWAEKAVGVARQARKKKR
jgi:DNA transformation protein and related proteins